MSKPDRKHSARLSLAYRFVLFGLMLICWTSGVGFFVLDTWVTVEGDFGPEKHPWQFPVLQAHGAVAFALMILFGHLWAGHMQPGWRSRSMRPLGLALAIAFGLLIASAYMLYYVGGESLRESTIAFHTYLGFVFPALLVAHPMQAWLRRRRRRKTRGSTLTQQA